MEKNSLEANEISKMIKDAGSKYDDYWTSSKIRQILLHLGYELTEKIFFFYWIEKLMYIKMSYYWFNRKNLARSKRKIF